MFDHAEFLIENGIMFTKYCLVKLGLSVLYEHSRSHKSRLGEFKGPNGSNEESEGSTVDMKRERKSYT